MLNNVMLSLINRLDEAFTDFFKNIFSRLNLTTLIVFLIGIMVGLFVAGCMYSLLLTISVKKNPKIKEIRTPSITDDEMKKLVEQIKQEYLEKTTGYTTPEKIKVLGPTVKDSINVIASKYYPNSKYPLYELTINEFLNLLNYVTIRLDDIFDKRIFSPFKNLSISQIVRILETRKKVETNKLAKAASTVHLKTISKVGFTILNYANPFYWLKKIIFGGVMNYTSNKIALVIIDVVADETNKIYSKRIFNSKNELLNSEIEKSIREIENELKGEKNEQR